MGGQAGYSGQDPDAKGFQFTDASIRRGFIRKVYAILMVRKIWFLQLSKTFVRYLPRKIRKYFQIICFI